MQVQIYDGEIYTQNAKNMFSLAGWISGVNLLLYAFLQILNFLLRGLLLL